MIWDINPELFNLNIFGFHLAPRYYGLAFVLGFFLAEKYISKIMYKNGYSKEEMSTLFTYSLIGCIVGARLGHCLFYEPGYYLSNPFEIMKVWKGGLASHGGFIGVIISVSMFNKKAKKKLDFLWLLDLVAAPALLGGVFIRLGNLMNSEILGRPTDLPWGFIFKRVDNIPRHPAQLYEALGYFVVSMFGYYFYKKYQGKWPKGRHVGYILIGGMGWRFFTEFFKENQVAFEQGMLINMGQVLSLVMMVVGFGLFYFDKVKALKKTKKNG